jgi:AraC family transcriptional regulator
MHPGTWLPMGQRLHFGLVESEMTGDHPATRSHNSAADDVIHSVVEITPPDITKRRFVSWPHMAAELVQFTSRERIEFRFHGRAHLLAMYEQSVRRDGITILGGSARSTLRNASRKLVFVPSGHEFYEWQDPRALTRVTYFYFDCANQHVRSELDNVETSFAPRLYFEDPAIWNTAIKLKGLIERPKTEDRLYVEALGAVLVHELVRLSHGTPRIEQRVRGGLAAWQQRIIIDYIEEHLTEPIELTVLARLVRLSPYHFCRAFKKSFGLPPHQYHSSCRIEHAKTLLAKPKCSVTEIALKVGFNETSSFTRAFRKATGLTPTGYHRSLV